jgi:multimeric flavodoxin WrbA
MTDKPLVTAIVGSYRKGGVIDTAVDEILAGAAERGATVEKIYLIDQPIEFCSNCRACTQEPGEAYGPCAIEDDFPELLARIDAADALVLGSPTNFGTVTAVMKRFIERLVCGAYWPWGQMAPKLRKRKTKRAVVVTASAAPGFLGRAMFSVIGSLKQAARVLGARTIGVVNIGLAAGEPEPGIRERTRRRARRLGHKLAG